MLQYWVDSDTPHKGVHVYDIRSKRSYISTGLGAKAFSFAIVDDLHIPIVNGKRAVGMEKWFSALEGPLSTFIRQAHARKKPLTFQPPEKYTRTLMALLGLECRSRYNLALIQRELEHNDSLTKALDDGRESAPKTVVLENLVHAVSEKLAYICPTELNIVHAPRGRSWITCDRPFITSANNLTGFRHVVLTNKVLLSYRRSEDGTDNYSYSDATVDFADLINNEVALTARDWLVADSPRLLAKYAALTQTDEWHRRVAEDQLSFLPIKHLTTGWAITR